MEAYQLKKNATNGSVGASQQGPGAVEASTPAFTKTNPVPIDANKSSELAKGVSPSNNLLRSSASARDKYAMKFNGWQPSQPDSGLPPSSGAAVGSGTPRTGSFLTNVI